jgi:gamma-glutamyltranspeptidase/glutathione hydrolase
MRGPHAAELLVPGTVRAPLAGEIFRNPNLAEYAWDVFAPLHGALIPFSTFEALAIHGRDGFYRGRIAQAIVSLLQSRGGL